MLPVPGYCPSGAVGITERFNVMSVEPRVGSSTSTLLKSTGTFQKILPSMYAPRPGSTGTSRTGSQKLIPATVALTTVLLTKLTHDWSLTSTAWSSR